jgi:hypothetical protein
MAVQYQFAYSSEVVGTGVFAGGPYYCMLSKEERMTSFRCTRYVFGCFDSLHVGPRND